MSEIAYTGLIINQPSLLLRKGIWDPCCKSGTCEKAHSFLAFIMHLGLKSGEFCLIFESCHTEVNLPMLSWSAEKLYPDHLVPWIALKTSWRKQLEKAHLKTWGANKSAEQVTDDSAVQGGLPDSFLARSRIQPYSTRCNLKLHNT